MERQKGPGPIFQKDENMKMTIEESALGRIVRIEGDVTIEQARDFQGRLAEMITEKACLILDVERIGDIDITALQTLCSAHRTAEGLNASLMIGRNWPEGFRQSVKDTGFTRKAACALRVRGACLWTEGGNG
jgi:anti-anti-sigma regulatory factor